MGGSMEGQPPTEADFLVYCAENLDGSLSSIPAAESTHPKELDLPKARQVENFLTKGATQNGDADRVQVQIQHCSLFTTAKYMEWVISLQCPGTSCAYSLVAKPLSS